MILVVKCMGSLGGLVRGGPIPAGRRYPITNLERRQDECAFLCRCVSLPRQDSRGIFFPTVQARVATKTEMSRPWLFRASLGWYGK